jgi:hypothetical protein
MAVKRARPQNSISVADISEMSGSYSTGLHRVLGRSLKSSEIHCGSSFKSMQLEHFTSQFVVWWFANHTRWDVGSLCLRCSSA